MTYPDYVKMVKKFRETFGLKQDDPKLHDKLFNEEAEELFQAQKDQDKAEVADAICDLLFVWIGKDIDVGVPMEQTHAFFEDMKGIARDAGIYLPAAFEMVYESNMSKLCTKEEVVPTWNKYLPLGVNIEHKEVSDGLYAVYATNDTEHAPKGKLLKSVGFFEPKWEAKPKRWLI
jgi:Phosphoribosyl-ATP pyrophosphohydrolase